MKEKAGQSLPLLLEQQLAAILRRYRRLRLLRAGARFLVLAALVAIVAGGVVVAGLPIPSVTLTGGAGFLLLAAFASCFLPVVRRPASLREIAAYIDAEHPEFQDRLLSAVVLTEGKQPISSAWMLEHLLADTQYRVKGVPLHDFMRPWEYRLLVAGVAAGSLLVIVGGLAILWRSGILRSARVGEDPVVTAVTFTVEPGDAVVQPGDNQIIWVTTPDDHATRFIVWEQGGAERRAVMTSSSAPEVSFHTFEALQEGLHYRVQVGEASSDRYEIIVNRPPGVKSIQLQYRYPEYLQMEPKVVPFGSEIAAVEGTRVTVQLEATTELRSADLVRDTGEALAMAPVESDRWEASFELENSGTYHLALRDTAGTANPSPEEFAIEVYHDKAPEIRVRFPRGDSEVLPVEEVPFAFEVKDDFGVADYGIAYTVAGREPVRLALNTRGDAVQELAGSHLLVLEEMALAGGDLITWSVWADDRKPGRAEFEVTGDPFFLEVRPYVRRYRENITEGGGEGASGEAREIMDDQRGVVISIHQLRKSVAGMGEEAYVDGETRIAEAQAGIREGLETGMGQGMMEDTALAEQAIAAMKTVEAQLQQAAWPAPQEALGVALSAAQAALQALVKLEPELRTVTRMQGGGSGGGGGGGASQQEIDGLELSKRKDYQEDARTGAAEAQEREEIRKGLDDLARRQEILNDDMAKLLSEEARALEEAERKRQLERLREEQERQLERLDDLANQVAQGPMTADQRQEVGEEMDRARQQMESSLQDTRRGALQEARASGSRAGQHLAQAESGLDQLTREAARARMEALEEELGSLQERQQSVLDEVESLKADQATPGVEGQEALSERVAALGAEKLALAEDTRTMLEGAGGLSDQLRENQELLSRKLGDWVRRTSRTGVVEDMEREESRRMMEFGAWEALQGNETRIQEKLAEAAEALAGLEKYLPGNAGDDMARALDMLHDLEGLDRSPDANAGSDGAAESDSERGGGVPEEQGHPGGAPGEAGDPTESALAMRTPEAPDMGDPTEAPGSEVAGGAQPGNEQGGRDSAQSQPDQAADARGPAAGAEPPGGAGGNPGDAATGGEEGAGGPQPNGDRAGNSREGGAAGGGRGDLGAAERFQGGDSSLGDFFDQDVSNWRPVLRDAAALLPADSAVRGALEQVEMDLGRFQREYNNGGTLPEPEAFEQVVRRPLMDTMDTLEQLVRAQADGDRQWLQDEGAVPVQYVDRVAEYTRALAEQPETP